MANETSKPIDNRWLDAATEQLRIIKGSSDQITQGKRNLETHESRKLTAEKQLEQIKAAIAAGTPFPEPKAPAKPA